MQEEMIAAGVRPDRFLSCARQTINGYVSDLCPVVGVVPIDGRGRDRSAAAHIGGLLAG